MIQMKLNTLTETRSISRINLHENKMIFKYENNSSDLEHN